MTVTGLQGDHAHPTIRVFGGMGIFDDGEPTSIGGPRQQKLLALLTVRAGAVVDIDWLAEHLWTDDDRPEATAPALRTYVSRLRSAFPEVAQAWIETVPSGYRLAAPENAIEHLRVAALRAAAKEARDREDPLASARRRRTRSSTAAVSGSKRASTTTRCCRRPPFRWSPAGVTGSSGSTRRSAEARRYGLTCGSVSSSNRRPEMSGSSGWCARPPGDWGARSYSSTSPPSAG